MARQVLGKIIVHEADDQSYEESHEDLKGGMVGEVIPRVASSYRQTSNGEHSKEVLESPHGIDQCPRYSCLWVMEVEVGEEEGAEEADELRV